MGMVYYFSGLDLGQAAEFTALAVLEQTFVQDPHSRGQLRHYAVRHLQRFELNSPYTAIARRLAELFSQRPLAGSRLSVDHTGVGQPVIDLLRRASIRASIHPIAMTGGHKAIPSEGSGWLVPKTALVSTLQVLLQARRIKVAPTLPDAQTLVQELVDFKVKVRLAENDALASWREGPRDDLVFAIAIAAWMAERMRPGQPCAGGQRPNFQPYVGPGGLPGAAWPKSLYGKLDG
jgi:hypothetical protein